MNNPKVCRAGDRCPVSTLGELIYCVVHHSDIPPKQIADALEMRVGYLLDAANYDRDDTHFQMRKWLPMLRVANRWDAMEKLATLADGVFFQLPRVTAGNTDVIDQSSRMLREFSEVLAVVAQSEATPQAAARLAKEGREAIAEIARLVRLMEAKAQTGGPRALHQVAANG